ncbi:MAG TPA: ATP-binding protein [Actinomycetota bacterium]|nr:ATP-binding protein [Actinomycetota bacterium]
MGTQHVGGFEQAKRLESGLIWVRYFAVVLGTYLVSQSNTGPPPHASETVLLLGLVIMGVLAVGNFLISRAVSRIRSFERIRRLGAVIFAFDIAVVLALVWLFNYDPNGDTWAILFILPLEGAIRFQLKGALAPVGIALLNEVAREAYLGARFPAHPFLVPNVVFRVGVEAIVALVAGYMAKKYTEAYLQERRLVERLEAVDEMKNTFLQAVSHELRTPLTSILGTALVLQRPDVDLAADDARDLVGRLARNARKLNRLLADLLDVDRLSRGVVGPSLQPTDVGELVRRVASDQDVVGGSSLHVDVQRVLVPVDAPKVERIVENLIANAVKHTPQGTPIWVMAAREDGGALITVEDAGWGVPEGLRDDIFKPFRQGPDVPAHSPGIGMGLALVARFAELHGGRAWLEERPGGGASFKVFLPGTNGTKP